jgi:hypothetical protein
MCLAVVAVFLIFSISIPHMYTRVWIVPVFLAFACSMARERAVRLQRKVAHPSAQNPQVQKG